MSDVVPGYWTRNRDGARVKVIEVHTMATKKTKGGRLVIFRTHKKQLRHMMIEHFARSYSPEHERESRDTE